MNIFLHINFRICLGICGAIKRDFGIFIRQNTSPNENFEYGYPHSNAPLTFFLQKVSDNLLSLLRLHPAAVSCIKPLAR